MVGRTLKAAKVTKLAAPNMSKSSRSRICGGTWASSAKVAALARRISSSPAVVVAD